MDSRLPDDFDDLAFWIDWAQPTEYLRNRKRWSASMEESQRFYDMMQSRCPDALSYLDRFPLPELDASQRTLLNMCLALAEVSATIEMYGEAQPKYVFPMDRFVPLHDAWTLGLPRPPIGVAQ